ncbi:sugar ABC transporter ATP-binding protein (plasmid) [Shinella sp. PSBB067]|uniref:sugar ABC transporter ATP-binding protein n=1 Tax=unclassified Shinella TaxID=2643062 RepID=UPI00193BFC3E|nr:MULTISPECIES: sugar ABC transporter ATP-binding protein [unclassified Shinella]QRI66622.1 sugar ABC transporter ATP-binding protein [Shinella sp. PSBB067]
MAVRLHNIKVHYPGVKALDGVSIQIRQGEVHGIIGENGAGKSTLMNVLSGSVRVTDGTIELDGVETTFDKPADAVARGISLVSQEGSLVPHLSAAANICLGFESTHFKWVLQNREMARIAARLRDRWFPETAIDFDVPVSELPYASQKIIEILRALHSDPKILILDEPTATLPAREKDSLGALIRKISADGVGVVLISHFMAEVLHLSDHITALQDGKVVESLPNQDLTERDLVGLMFNRQGGFAHLQGSAATENTSDFSGIAPLLSIDGWLGENFEVQNFEARPGEIVGLIGLTGAGHSDFAGSIFQPRLASQGNMRIAGRNCKGLSVRQMRVSGVAYIPDHRMTNALVGHWTIRESISLVNISHVADRFLGYIKRGAEKKEAAALAQRLRVKMSSIEQKISELSGGNKQKVSIGRWLYAAADKASIFIFVEPTEGVDIGSKQEIHNLMRSLAKDGAAVIVVSSDLLEIAAVADRVVPFSRGRSGPSISKSEFSEKTFVDAIVGIAA